MILFSFLNLATSASLAASTTFTEAETDVGLRHPERPHLRGYTADLSGGRITLDFGVATSLQVTAPIHGNFTAATVQGNATDTWGGPSYSRAITLARSHTRRFSYAHLPTVSIPFNYRFWSLSVPTQDSTDGATRFALGGIWAGLLTTAPRDIRMTPLERLHQARQDITTEDGRRIQRIDLDDPCFWLTVGRHAENTTMLEAWREIDRQWAEAPDNGAALVIPSHLEPQNCYVMRRADEEEAWPNARIWSESTMEAFEVTAG